MEDPRLAPTGKLLAAMQAGDAGATEAMFELAYDELRRIASRLLAGSGPATLQPTALVHEAWLKLGGGACGHADRRHFVRVAAKAMRCVLVDRFHSRATDKRGGHARRVTLDPELAATGSGASAVDDMLAIAASLERLGSIDPELERIVELRFFGGLTHQEIADNLGTSLRSVERSWQLARAWLAQDLATTDGA